MAITTLIAPTTAAVSGAATDFTTAGPFVLYGDGFAYNEGAHLLRLGPSGNYIAATNKQGIILVSSFPNMVYVEAPGTYRVDKLPTAAAASVGYEEFL